MTLPRVKAGGTDRWKALRETRRARMFAERISIRTKAATNQREAEAALESDAVVLERELHQDVPMWMQGDANLNTVDAHEQRASLRH